MIDIKTLEELNREFISERETAHSPSQAATPANAPSTKTKKRVNPFTVIADTVFFILIIAALILAVTYINTGEAKPFFGYSYYTVLTSSMQDEIPQGSLILTQRTNPKELNVGDNITFLRDYDTHITHKIVEIYDNYQDQDIMGFKTKGVNNSLDDEQIVLESEILGKVIHVYPTLGESVSAIGSEAVVIFIVFGALAVLYIILRLTMKRPQRDDVPKEKNVPKGTMSLWGRGKGFNKP